MSETQRVLAAAVATETIADARGRQIAVRRVTRRESMRLMRGWGTACNVQMWLGNALLAATARSVDGVPLPNPVTPEQAEATVDRLDDDGLNAIGEWLQAQAEVDVTEAAKN